MVIHRPEVGLPYPRLYNYRTSSPDAPPSTLLPTCDLRLEREILFVFHLNYYQDLSPQGAKYSLEIYDKTDFVGEDHYQVFPDRIEEVVKKH